VSTPNATSVKDQKEANQAIMELAGLSIANGSGVVDESVAACMSTTQPIFPTSEPSLTIVSLSALPVPGSKVLHVLDYGESLWGKTSKVTAQLPSGETENYFLKVDSSGATASVFLLIWLPRWSLLVKLVGICAKGSLNHSKLSMLFLLALSQSRTHGESTPGRAPTPISCLRNSEMWANRYVQPTHVPLKEGQSVKIVIRLLVQKS
jgi:hypothetical protein